jgi:hypothetical protein
MEPVEPNTVNERAVSEAESMSAVVLVIISDGTQQSFWNVRSNHHISFVFAGLARRRRFAFAVLRDPVFLK